MTSKPTEHPPYRVASRLGGVQFAISCRQPKVMAYRSAASSSCCRLPRTRLRLARHTTSVHARASSTMSLATLLEGTCARARPRWNRSRERGLAARVSASGSRDVESAPRDATSSSSSTSRSVAGDLVSVALPSLSRYAGSGAAMLRNGGAAVRHYADVARGGRGARPSSWSPGLTIGELLSGFLEGIDLRPSEVDALLAGEGDDLVAYVRSLRAVMAVGIPPLPGTRVEPVRIRWGDARHSAAWLIPAPPRNPRRDPPRHPLAARRRVHPVRHLHARPAPLIRSARRGRQGPLGGVSARAGSGGTSTRFERRRTRIDGSSTTPAGASIRATSSWVATRREDTSRSSSCASSRRRAGAGWDPTERRRARVAAGCPPGWC